MKMINQIKRTGLRWLWLTILVVVLDQLTKAWVVYTLPYGFDGWVVTSFFNLVHVYNHGAAFSFLADQSGWQRWFFVCLATGIGSIIIYWLSHLSASQKWESGAYALVLGGALGNLIDRTFLGYVIDFLDFHINQYHWPAFNVADTAICIGAGMLIIGSLVLNKNKEQINVPMR